MSTQDPDSQLESAPRHHRLIDSEWRRDWNRWVVSAQLDDSWTLVGLFEDSLTALRAAGLAARQLGLKAADPGTATDERLPR